MDGGKDVDGKLYIVPIGNPNNSGKCVVVDKDKSCQNTEVETKNIHNSAGKVYLEYRAAKKKANQLRKKYGKIRSHYSSMKKTVNECWCMKMKKQREEGKNALQELRNCPVPIEMSGG